MGQRFSFRNRFGRRINLSQLNCIIELSTAAFDLLFARLIDGCVRGGAVFARVFGWLWSVASCSVSWFEGAFLSLFSCVLFAMVDVVNHAEYSCPVASYQLVECSGVTGLASFHQVQFRHIGLRQSRFRLHDWTERALISFNAESCLARTGDATRRDTRPSSSRCRRALQKAAAAVLSIPNG